MFFLSSVQLYEEFFFMIIILNLPSFIKAAVSETSLHNNQDEGAVPNPAAVFSLTRFFGIY